MGRKRVIQAVGVSAVVFGAALWVWQRGTTQSAHWVVSEVRDQQRTLVIAWTTRFAYCAERPSVDVDEQATEIRVVARYRTRRGVECGLQVGKSYPPAVVRLRHPVAGKSIHGPGQASVPVAWSTDLRRMNADVMPSLLGLDAAGARRALSRARYQESQLPSPGIKGFVTSQSPRPGARISTGRPTNLPTRAPRLVFSGG